MQTFITTFLLLLAALYTVLCILFPYIDVQHVKKVKAGKHWFHPIMPMLCFNGRHAWRVRFTPSCKYDIGSEDQFDINKLCGVCYFNPVKWLIFCFKQKRLVDINKIDSARWGWRNIKNSDYIELLCYCYIDGIKWERMAFLLKVDVLQEITLKRSSKGYFFRILGHANCSVPHNNPWGIPLYQNCYFGGNQTAPQNMTIHINKIPVIDSELFVYEDAVEPIK